MTSTKVVALGSKVGVSVEGAVAVSVATGVGVTISVVIGVGVTISVVTGVGVTISVSTGVGVTIVGESWMSSSSIQQPDSLGVSG